MFYRIQVLFANQPQGQFSCVLTGCPRPSQPAKGTKVGWGCELLRVLIDIKRFRYFDLSLSIQSHYLSQMPRLLLFSGSQSPLSVRYPRPAKSNLVLPPLVHRALHTALDPQQPSALVDSDTVIIPHPGALSKHAFTDGEYETTVKFQLTEAHTPETVVGFIREALRVLAERKGLNVIDVLLLGLPENVDGGKINAFMFLHANWYRRFVDGCVEVSDGGRFRQREELGHPQPSPIDSHCPVRGSRPIRERARCSRLRHAP